MIVTLTTKQYNYCNLNYPDRFVSAEQNKEPFENLVTCKLANFVTPTLLFDMGMEYARHDEQTFYNKTINTLLT